MTRESRPKAAPAENVSEHTPPVHGAAFSCPVCGEPMPAELRVTDQAYHLGRHLEGHDERLVGLLYRGLRAKAATP